MSGVPDGWSLDRLGKHLKLQGGYAFRSDDFTQTGIPIVRISNIEDFKVNLKNVLFHSEKPSLSPYVLRRGDVLIAMSGATTGKVGKYTSDAKAYLNQRVGRFCPRDAASCSMEFFFQLSQTSQFQRLIALDSIGGAQPNVSSGEIENAVMLWPPIREQRKIADILSTWDEAIEQQTRLLKLKRERKRGLMQRLLTGKVRFKEFEGLEWREVVFDEVLDLQIGGTPARKEPSYWDSEHRTENRWMSIADLKGKKVFVTKERITDLGARKSNTKLIPAGSLVMSFKLTIGRRAILGLPMYTNEAICALIPKNSSVVDVEFLYQYLEIVDFEQGVDQAVKGKTLNKEKIRLLQLSLPAIEEQQKIAAVLSAADAELETFEAQLAALRTQKRGLMQRLLTGKTRVKVDAAPARAAVLP